MALSVTIGTAAGANAPTLNVPYPSGVAAGNLIAMHIATGGGSVTNPSGWTVVHNESTVSNPQGGMFYKIASGSESGSLAVTISGTLGTAGSMILVTDNDAVTPEDVAPTNVSYTLADDTTIEIPSQIVISEDVLLIYGGAGNSSTVTFTGPAGSTEIHDYAAEAVSPLRAGAWYYELITDAGATLDRIITMSAARAYWGAMLAVRPSSVSSQLILPDADIVTTGWSTAPLFSKVNDTSDATVISATAS
jgi:hypothetical protein